MSAKGPTLHHLSNSQSQRILWLLEELRIAYNLQYELKLHDRVKSGPDVDRAPPELKKTHPLGKSPQLVTETGRVIIESSAIASYLIKTYDTEDKFKGTGPANDDIRDELLSSFANASVMIPVIIGLVSNRQAKESPFFIRPVFKLAADQVHKRFTNPELEAMFKYMDNELGDQDYFMGTQPGRADFMLSWPVDFALAQSMIDLALYPKVKAWFARIHARPAWISSVEKGNEYKLTA